VKSSALIGGSSVINIVLGIIRTKALALFIGPSGMGLYGAYSSLTALVSSISGMGISTSGVRQIAEATGTNDQEKIAITATILRRTSFFLGLLGAVFLVAFSQPLAKMTFGDTGNTGALALLSLTIFFSQIAAGQAALVQGLRQIRHLAAISVWGGVWGTCLSIPIVYFWREKGIVSFLMTVSALSILSSWWFARKVEIPRVRVPFNTMLPHISALLRMGIVFMASGLMVSSVAYLTRVLIIREMSLQVAGFYQAAYTLAGVYVGFILSAMGADYYPRLTAVASNDREVNRLVNEQTEAALLMALPGILATLTAAPFVIRMLYSSEFAVAAEILRWQIIGIFGRIVTWPMGFVLVAKGRAKTFFWTELLASSLQLGFACAGMHLFGVIGLGIAFSLVYLIYSPIIFFIVHRETGFRWSASNEKLLLLAMTAIIVVFLFSGAKELGYWAPSVGATITVAVGVASLKALLARVGVSKSPIAWIRLKLARAIS
jgi:enterobacterial common antigen flippase